MKTVIITGANGNLGSAVTMTFLDKGYKVIATVVAESMISELAPHEHLEVQVVNLTNETETRTFVLDTIQKYKEIDAALLLVGGFAMGNIAATNGEDIDKQISLNFKTAFHVVRPLLTHMLESENGRIVFIGARPAIEPKQGKELISYGLSKSLLFKLAEYINEEGRAKNVTATVVVPSTLDTPLNRKSMPDVNPGDWVKPRKLAELLEFSVSDTSSILREVILKAYNNA
jgi:NAD(P)-dependent dehydrogenase (short-subunit alcohol dehydrogenase family)